MDNKKENNFHIIRFVGALLVISGHMSVMIGGKAPNTFLGASYRQIHAVGIAIFFLIGGYLISKSWRSDPNLLRFFIKRCMRIFPPLWVALALCAWVLGPLLTTLPKSEYFGSWLPFYYFVRNALLFPVYVLPGVFETNVVATGAVNGSLWSLPVEFAMYLMIPAFSFVITRFHEEKHQFYCCLTVTAGVCVLSIVQPLFFPNWETVFYGVSFAQALVVVPFYFIGVLFTFPEVTKHLSVQKALVLVLFSQIIPLDAGQWRMVWDFTVFPYVLFSLALANTPEFARFSTKHEITYGMYLYSFPVQQTIVYICMKNGISLNIYGCLALSVAVSMLLAFLSCIFIEEPCQRCCKTILGKLNNNCGNCN